MKPRHLYEVSDIAIDRLANGSTALQVLTKQDVDLTILLTRDQLLRLRSKIASPITPKARPSLPQSKA
jgi:hypothetical protein